MSHGGSTSMLYCKILLWKYNVILLSFFALLLSKTVIFLFLAGTPQTNIQQEYPQERNELYKGWVPGSSF